MHNIRSHIPHTCTFEMENILFAPGQNSFVIHADQIAAEILAADDGGNGCSCAKLSCTCCVRLDVFKWDETGNDHNHLFY